ncbi:anion transporter [Limnochorda pilosa]|uniref:Anion transporter n=1 Tax=Limnochorda pilosa TaxID=1555112 RepID=A0A0K2SQ46_LIMPI|nr:anion transporter [Limnochorda pilosa]
MTLLISMGKGGTGKTTVAASLAVRLASDGFRVLVASIDPAHNLGDVLERPLGSEPSAVPGAPGLWALEVDTDRALERYLERASREVTDAYRYLETLNLDRFLEGLRYAPGVEEQATLEAVGELLQQAEADRFDVLVLDTPPTGQTLRVLALPGISLRWAQELHRVRRAILDRRQAVSRILGHETAVVGGEQVTLPSEEEGDPISRILAAYVEQTRRLRQRFQDVDRTGVLLVRNPDRLSGLESQRALGTLGRFGVPLAQVVVNRTDPREPAGTSADALPLPDLYPHGRLPLLQPEPSGAEALRALSTLMLDPAGSQSRGGTER